MVMVFHLFYLLSLTEMFHGTLVSYVILIDYLELVTLPIHPSSITICQLVQTSLCPTPVQSQEGKQLWLNIQSQSLKSVLCVFCSIFFQSCLSFRLSLVILNGWFGRWGLQHPTHHSPHPARPHAAPPSPPRFPLWTVPPSGLPLQLSSTPPLPAAGHGYAWYAW